MVNNKTILCNCKKRCVMLNQAKVLVAEIMAGDNSGHGMEHINRVLDLALRFAKNEECNKTLVALGALLHDVDDYKLFGNKNQANLTNTNIILEKIGADAHTKNAVLDIVANIGFSKRLSGKSPSTIEGKIVSDADMCDALGASGIIRTMLYTTQHNRLFFDKNLWPLNEVTHNTYNRKCSDSAVCHLFEKVLKLKELMLTKAGKIEATKRHNFVIAFLRQYFTEENATEWLKYLDNYLSNL